jgi:hypothetical protein
VNENNKPPAYVTGYGDGWRAALRALPILRTCGECGWCGTRMDDERVCRHSGATHGNSGEFPPVSPDAAPPDFCPLRKEPAR